MIEQVVNDRCKCSNDVDVLASCRCDTDPDHTCQCRMDVDTGSDTRQIVSNTKSILFLSLRLPYPPFSGGKIKSWKLVEFLGRHYDLTVGSILKEDDEEFLDDFTSKAQLCDFFTETVYTTRSAKNLIKSFIRRMPLNLFRTYSRHFADTVRDRAKDFDMILIDHYEVFQYIPDSYKGVIVLHEHNAEYVMWEGFARAGINPLERMVCYLESQRVRRYEAQACGRADLVFAAPNDIDKLAEIGVDRSKCKVTYHLGDDTQLELPSLRFDDTEKALLNVGSLTWEANIDGLLWFIKNTWPLLKKQHSDLKFYIVGKNPDLRLIKAVRDEPDIILTGFVEDLESLYRRCRVFVAPLRFGSGIKVKVLNAMCRGIPAVTTSVGTEGLSAENMKHLAIADSSKMMAKAIDLLLIDRNRWESLESNSRELIYKHYTWKRLFKEMKTNLDIELTYN